MTEKYKTHSPEFRLYVSKMIVLDGHKMTEISRKLGIPYGTVKGWVHEYRERQRKAEKEKQNQLLTASEYKELFEKERQNRLEMEEENEILKKAMHIFTQEKE